MCGIWGMVSHNGNMLKQDVMDPMRSMYLLTSLRGEHSTGMMCGKKEFNSDEIDAFWYKSVGNPYEFFKSKHFERFERDYAGQSRTFWGHGRHATKGTVTTANAHPFVCDHITLIHNGTISKGVDVAKDGTDSEAVCKSIAKKGLQETLDGVEGAYVLVWIDTKDGTVNIIRNSQRTLYQMDIVNDRSFFASEGETLEYLRTKHLTANERTKCNYPYLVDTGKLYSYDLVGNDKPHIRPMTFKTAWQVTAAGTVINNAVKTVKKPNVVPLLPPVTTGSPKAVEFKELIGKNINFIVERTTKEGNGMIAYHGEAYDNENGIDGNKIVFRTRDSREFEDKMDSLLCGKVASVSTVFPSQKITFTIKTKTIEEYDVNTDAEEDDNNITLVTLQNGEMIEEGKYLSLALSNCFHCASPIALSDAAEVQMCTNSIGVESLECPDCVKLKSHYEEVANDITLKGIMQ